MSLNCKLAIALLALTSVLANVVCVAHVASHRTLRPNKPLSTYYTDAAEADRITSLPGWGTLDVGMFGGYITVNEDAGRALYYVFVESETDAANRPVLLWLNGGPGCSSLGGGFLSELGPFFPTASANGSLQANPYSWHKFASVVFLDSPAFVGYSYSNTSADNVVGDARTAADAKIFLEGFFQRFPQYQKNDFWLTGESYAGHYVPNLAWEILKPAPSTASGAANAPTINLKGFIVGNAWTDTATDNIGAVDYWWSHGIISDDAGKGIVEHCDFAHMGPLMKSSRRSVAKDERGRPVGVREGEDSSRLTEYDYCDIYCNQALWEMGNINIYDIYADVCFGSANSPSPPTPEAQHAKRARRAAAPARQLARMMRDAPLHHGLSLRNSLRLQDPEYDPCVDDEVQTYFRRPDVMEALHAHTAGDPWSDCNESLEYSYDDLLTSVLPVYQNLLKQDIRIYVYSGDVDAIVPVVGTRRWVAGLGLNVTKYWRPWVSSTKQVGGYIIDYDGLTFATVRGAGHMVPYVQPERASVLISSFLAGKDPHVGA